MGVDINRMRTKIARAATGAHPREAEYLRHELAMHRWALAKLTEVLNDSPGAHDPGCLRESTGGGCTCSIGNLIRRIRRKLRGS